ncbi:hypothetical protein ABZX40_40670 [Streptomyces sp. NPDC004610]|uniref:hypothetical protein n=1 Tax=unclassified Streptomyces TaxID=2593676 RepID=UPI0033BA172E
MRGRGRGRVGVGFLVALLVTVGCTGCTGVGSGGPASTAPSPPPAPAFGEVFLGDGECSSFGTTAVTEVPCAGERAAARVVARREGKAGEGGLCPGTTDFVLHISAQRPTHDEDGDGSVAQGYACMRHLQPPHPGDPGGGGGPRTIVGDCVYGAGGGQVRETPCDGGGRHRPEYRVTEAVADRDRCPPATVLYVQLGGTARPVGCAERT